MFTTVAVLSFLVLISNYPAKVKFGGYESIHYVGHSFISYRSYYIFSTSREKKKKKGRWNEWHIIGYTKKDIHVDINKETENKDLSSGKKSQWISYSLFQSWNSVDKDFTLSWFPPPIIASATIMGFVLCSCLELFGWEPQRKEECLWIGLKPPALWVEH